MVILTKLSSDQWIGICTLVTATLVGVIGNIIAYLQYRKAIRLPKHQKILRPLDKWKRNSLCVRIFLHRLSAITTLILVLVLVRQTSAKFVIYMLLGVIIFEVFWLFKHLHINLTSKHKGKKEGLAYIIPQKIENHIDLKYKGSDYPPFSLLIELFALTYLCIISGGLGSPFFFLFAMFCVLALYISYSTNLIRSTIYIISFYSCFWLITYLAGYEFTLGGINYEILKSYRMKIGPENSYLFKAVYIWSTITCGLLFLGITSYFARIGEEQLNAPVERTKDILTSRNLPIKLLSNLPVFRIGGNATFHPETTLALLPYCARGPRCQIRLDNEKQPEDRPINGKQCRLCKPLCAIGKLVNYQNIAEIKVIGSHHKIDETVKTFRSTHELTHVIVVCCTARLAKYLSKLDEPEYKNLNITLIYTPLLTGTDTCLSSTDIMHKGRATATLPLTSFDAEALINGLTWLI